MPWLEVACARKNDLYHKFVRTPTPENKTKYDKMNEFCAKHVDIAKNKYHKSYFEKYKDNSRKQWQMINGLLNRNKNGNSGINKLIDNEGNSITNGKEISENFNEYFCNIASNLKGSSHSPLHRTGIGTYSDFMKHPVTNTIHLNDADAGEIYSTIKNFKNKSTRDTKMSALKIANE